MKLFSCTSKVLSLVILICVNAAAVTDWSLVPPTSTAYEKFGYTVAIDGSFVVVGITEASTTSRVYIYKKTTTPNATYTLEATLTGQTGSHFGSSVAIHGSTIVVGAPNYLINSTEYIGAVYMYTYSGSTWSEYAVIDGSTGSFSPSGHTPAATSLVGVSGDMFGSSVAVLHEQYMAVGAKSANLAGKDIAKHAMSRGKHVAIVSIC